MRGRQILCSNIVTHSGTGDWDDYVDWYNTHLPSSSGIDFQKWLVWKNTHGTVYYGNLPQHKKYQHVGHKWAPCPYDDNADLDLDPDNGVHTLRRIHLLGSVPAQTANHFDNGKRYYMKSSSRGSKWGFECTFSGCPYRLLNNKPYFYV